MRYVPSSSGRRPAWIDRLTAAEQPPRTTAWPLWPAALVLAAGWLLFGWPWLAGQVTIPWDAKAHFAPQAQFLAQSLARGDSPFWLPYAFSGTLQIADPQSLIFSPPFLLMALVNGNPGPWAIDVTVFITLLVCGIGVLLLARDLGWHPAAAILAALAFLFGASMAWRLQHFGQVFSLGYWPFALLFLRRALTRGSILYGALAGLVSAFILLGRDQVGLLALYLLAIYALWQLVTGTTGQPRTTIKTAVPPLAAGAVVGLAVAAIPLLMTLVYAAQSNRPEIDFIGAGRGSLHPALMVTAAVPHLFGAAGEMAIFWGPPSFTWVGTDLFIAQNMGQLYLGAIPLLLLIAGTVRGVLFNREIRYVTIAFVLVTLYAVGWFTPVFRLFYEFLPGVKMFRRPADATFLMGGLAALLAGYVCHRWWTDTLPSPAPWQRVLEAAFVALPFVAGLAFALWLDRLGLAVKPLLIAIAWFGAAGAVLWLVDWWRPIRPRAGLLLLSAFVAADLTVNNGPNGATALPPSELAMLDPASPSPTLALLKTKVRETTTETARPRVELTGLGFHWPNASLPHRLENVLGYNPVRLATYVEATGASDTVGLPDQRQFTPLFPSYRAPLADLLGLRFIATGVPAEQIDKRLKPGDLTLLAKTADGYVYENPYALPRVLFATAAVRADVGSILKTGTWPMPREAMTSTVALENLPPGADKARRPGSVRIAAYHNTVVLLEADSPDGGWVVLNDVWHPWWTATVDGRPADIARANVLFRAVEVPPGRHRIEFRLRPIAGLIGDLGRLAARN